MLRLGGWSRRLRDSPHDTPALEPRPVKTALRWSLFGALLLAFILVPFVALEDAAQAYVEATLRPEQSLGWVTLAVVGFLLLDIVLPIPSSFVLATAGFLLGGAVGTAVCFLGLSCASLLGYALGRFAGEPVATRIVGVAPLARFRELSARHGDWLLVAFRALPVLAEATTLLAGMARMPLPRFVLLVSLGNGVVAALYAWIGAVSAGQSSFLIASVAAMLLPVLLMAASRRFIGGATPGASAR